MSTKTGFYNGKHYTEYVNEVKRLKREDRLEDAEKLLLNLINAAESESRSEKMGCVPPWYYNQLAIVYRKRRDYKNEVKVIERFINCNTNVDVKTYYSSWINRLEKAKTLIK